MKWRSLPNFSAFKIGRRELVIHREIAAQAAEIVQKLGELDRPHRKRAREIARAHFG